MSITYVAIILVFVYSIVITTAFAFVIRRNNQTQSIHPESQTDIKYELEIEKTINYFATSLFGQNTIDDILWDVSKNCISKLNFEDCVIYLFNDAGDKLIQKAAFGPKNIDEYKIYNPIEIPLGKGIVGTVAQTGIHEVIHDTSKDERYIPDDKYRFSELSVPIKYQGNVIGVIDSEHADKNFFTPRHLQILMTISSLCANKIVKVKAEEEVRNRELKMIEMNKSVAEAKLVAFRAQMNPHFIFNCMAAIQECILTENLEAANTYLSRFSRLLRMVLENSEYNNITLEREIELLRIYLELESVRFKDKFEYHISVDGEIEEEETKIPTMILQPFVENAIWHGLLHKEDNRKLNISFSSKNELLICKIEDNGIGIKKSRENKLNGKGHDSKAMQMIQAKLLLIKEQFNNPLIGFEIHDKMNDANQVSGTEVIVTVPMNMEN